MAKCHSSFFSISLNNSSMAFGIQCAHTHFPHHKECTNEIIEIALAGVIYTRYLSWSFPNDGAAVAYLCHTHVSYFQMNVLLLVRLPTQCKQISHTHEIYGYVPWYLSPFYKGTHETDLLLDVFCLWIYLLNIYFHVVNSRSDQEIATVTLIRIELFTTVSQCSASSMTFSSSFDLIYLNIQLCMVVCCSTSWMNSIQTIFFSSLYFITV